MNNKLVYSTLIVLLSLALPLSANPKVSLQNYFPKLNFIMPIGMIEHPFIDNQWYLVEQSGKVVQIDNKQSTHIFADIQTKVDAGGEKGLLGMAFHPSFRKNNLLYFSYTAQFNGDLVSIISSWKVSGKKVDTNSEQILLRINQPYGNHNGGQITFGPDGYLYIGMGDGGWAGDPQKHGQNTNTLLGAMLRIDVDNGTPYSIPADNPFIKTGGKKEIYASGLRNPWRWSFDLKTGDLWLADVGQNRYEEINIIENGKNYGWNILEGKHCYKLWCSEEGYTSPIYEYKHNIGQSVTGGYVYRGKQIPELDGQYIFGDFVSGTIWSLKREAEITVKTLLKTDDNISSFAQSRDGEIYLLSYQKGIVYKLTRQP